MESKTAGSVNLYRRMAEMRAKAKRPYYVGNGKVIAYETKANRRARYLRDRKAVQEESLLEWLDPKKEDADFSLLSTLISPMTVIADAFSKLSKYKPTRVPMSLVNEELGDPKTWDDPK